MVQGSNSQGDIINPRKNLIFQILRNGIGNVTETNINMVQCTVKSKTLTSMK